jgi:protein-disulfide isomerase
MTNRQARREQSRTTRQQRSPQRGRPSSNRGGSSGGGGGGSSFLSLPFLLGAGVLVVLLVGALVAFTMFGGDDDDSAAVTTLRENHDNFPTEMVNGNSVGDPDAPVVLTEYSDFQCPFCIRHAVENEGMIIEEFVKTGKVRFEYKHYPILGQDSVRGAQATQCAARQNRFWDFQNRLFTIQAEAGQLTGARNNVGRFSEDNLRNVASDLGLDVAQYDTCMEGDEAFGEVSTHQEEARSFGLTGTPGFLINGFPLTAGNPANADAWREVLEAAYQDAVADDDGDGANGDGDATPTGEDEDAEATATP